jgi:hypothetical protein
VNGLLEVVPEGRLVVNELSTLNLASGTLTVRTEDLKLVPGNGFKMGGGFFDQRDTSGNSSSELDITGPFKVKNLGKYTYFNVNNNGRLIVGDTEAGTTAVPVYAGTTVRVYDGGELEINYPGLDFGTLSGTLSAYGGKVIVGEKANLVVTDTSDFSQWMGTVTNQGTISYTAEHVGSLSSVINKIDDLTFGADGGVVKSGLVNVKLGGDFYTTAAGTITLGPPPDKYKGVKPPRIVISGTKATVAGGGTLSVGINIARENVTLDNVNFEVGSQSKTVLYNPGRYSVVWVNASDVRILNSSINYKADKTASANVAVAVYPGSMGFNTNDERNINIRDTEIMGSTISVTAWNKTAAHGVLLQFGTSATVQNNIITGTRTMADDGDVYLNSPVTALYLYWVPSDFPQAQAGSFSKNTLNGHHYDFYLETPNKIHTGDTSIVGVGAGTAITPEYGSFSTVNTTFFKENPPTFGIKYLLDSLVKNSNFTNKDGGFVVLFDGRDPAFDYGREQYKIRGNTITNVSYWGAPLNWGSVDVNNSTGGPGNSNAKGFYISRTLNRAPYAGSASTYGSTSAQ